MKFNILKFLKEYGIIEVILSLLIGFVVTVILPDAFITYCTNKFTTTKALQTLIIYIAASILSFLIILIIRKCITHFKKRSCEKRELEENELELKKRIRQYDEGLKYIMKDNENMELLMKFFDKDNSKFTQRIVSIPYSSYLNSHIDLLVHFLYIQCIGLDDSQYSKLYRLTETMEVYLNYKLRTKEIEVVDGKIKQIKSEP